MSLEVLRSLGMSDEQIQKKIISKISDDFLRQQQPDLFSEDDDFAYRDDDDDELDDEDRAERDSERESLRKDASMIKLLSVHLRKHFKEQFSGALSQMTTEVVGPILRDLIQQKVFKQTNKWGEPVGGEVSTVMEFMEKKCKEYLLEDVDKDGKSVDECGQYNRDRWKKVGKRIDVLVETECDSRVSVAVKEACQAALTAVGEAYKDRITSAVSMAIGSVKIEVKK